jgi:hypothetical protein
MTRGEATVFAVTPRDQLAMSPRGGGCFLRGAAVCSCMVADTVTGIELGGGL